MNLKHLDDNTLLIEIDKLVRQERELLTSILHHLREIERRRLFSLLKYSSLYEYAVKRLGYSEDQAFRRIQAMRLLKEIPELEEKINSGALNLTNLGMAQSFFKREDKKSIPISKNQKIQILKAMEGATKYRAEKIIAELSPDEPLVRERVEAISQDNLRITFIAPAQLMTKVTTLKNLLSHKYPSISLSELIDLLCDIGIEKLTAPIRVLGRANSQASLHRRARAKGSCENCGGKYALEIDHKQPRSLGGNSEEANLRLLCRPCNQRAAIEKLGVGKMANYLNKH